MPERRWIPILVALPLPLAGLALLLLRPGLDLTWEHHPSHFWLVLGTAAVSVVLAFITNEAAGRHADARLILISLAFLLSAGFLGLHALATPGALLEDPNTGFVIATPVGLILASILSAASVSPLAGPRGRFVIRHRGALRAGAIGLLLAWGTASLLRLAPLGTATSAEAISGPVATVAAVAVALYAYAAWRFAGVAHRRSSAVGLALVVAMVLLAEAMVAVAFSRAWRLSWWEWHLLMTLAFVTIALATRAEYRRSGSLVSALRPAYGTATLARIDQWHSRAMAEIGELEAKGAPIDGLITDLRADGASAEEISALTAAAHELQRVDDLFRPYLPQHAADRLRETGEASRLGGATRVVTAMFADVAGFTSFSERQKPEVVITMLNTYWEYAVPIIEARLGSVEHFAGDGVLVLFNAFVEQPDHASRAASCALDLLDATDAIASAHAWPRFRIGVNTGPAVAGNVGSQARRSFASIGDATNVAARLLGVAEPGQVVIGPLTRAGIEGEAGLTATPLGPLQVKGRREPVEAWSLERSVS